jgi:iron(III) transport system substrate-binding protein
MRRNGSESAPFEGPPRRILVIPLLLLLFSSSCESGPSNEVILYCSLDQIFSEKLIKAFEAETGIRVKAGYDTEAQKTTGLVNRLLGERNNPQCDVFWNNESVLTLHMKSEGILAPYVSPNATTIPSGFKDPDGYWTGLAARCRVLIYNTRKIKEADLPTSILDLTDPKWKGRFTVARPLAGTTRTHFAVLYDRLGKDAATKWFRDLKANVGKVAEGNARVMRMVASGDYEFGITDTDDANIAKQSGEPVDTLFLDQGEGQMGTLVIPNSVMLIKGGPNPENGQKLIDYILSVGVEEKLARSDSVQIPLHSDATAPANVVTLDSLRPMEVDFGRVAAIIEEATDILREIYLD